MRRKIEDVRRPRGFLGISALGLVLLIVGWWGYRELSLRYTGWKYSREFTPGMKRQDIESRLLAERIRFWPEASQEFVSLGYEVFYPLPCLFAEGGWPDAWVRGAGREAFGGGCSPSGENRPTGTRVFV